MPPYAVPLSECEGHFGMQASMEEHMKQLCPRLESGDAMDNVGADVVDADQERIADIDAGPASTDDSAEELLLKLAEIMGGSYNLKVAFDDARSAQTHAEATLERAQTATEKEHAAMEVSRTAANVERAQADLDIAKANADEQEEPGSQQLAAKQFCADMINAKVKAKARADNADENIVYDENGRRLKRVHDRLSLVLEERQLLIDEEAVCRKNGNLDRLLQLEGLIDACNKYCPTPPPMLSGAFVFLAHVADLRTVLDCVAPCHKPRCCRYVFLLGGDIDVAESDEYDSEHDDVGALRGASGTSKSRGKTSRPPSPFAPMLASVPFLLTVDATTVAT